MLAAARRGLFFWRTEPRAPEAEESLAALLARRGQVRARLETAPSEPSPELFQPASPAPPPAFEPARDDASAPIPETQPPDEAAEKPGSTASRLLEAKRRARKKME